MSRSDAADAATASRRVGPPAWILLDTDAVKSDRQNSTTASARTKTGDLVQVTLCAAEPPRDSYLCVHSHGRKTHNCQVLSSYGDLALLAYGNDNYFIYRAGAPLPLLQLIPDFPVYSSPAGLLPFGAAGDFVLAVVTSKRRYEDDGMFQLNTFRSDRGCGAWTTAALELGSRARLDVENADKVIPLGGGELAWVNLRRGILVCDVLAAADDDDGEGSNLKPRVIPLPKLLPSNEFKLWSQHRGRYDARAYRDVAACAADGSIRCVEVEYHLRPMLPEVLDVSGADELRDADLPVDTYSISDYDDMEPRVQYEYLGWRVIVWSRTASCTGWRKERLLHVDDILANDPDHASLLREMRGDGDPCLA